MSNIKIGKKYIINGKEYILTKDGLTRVGSSYPTYSYKDSINKINQTLDNISLENTFDEEKQKNIKKEYISGTLAQDLEHYAHEVYTNKDIKAGINLVIEIVGLASLGMTAVTLVFIWLPGIGLPVSISMGIRILDQLSKVYSNLNAQQRKQVRAIISILKFGLN